MNGTRDIFQLFRNLRDSNTIIDEVYTVPTQVDGPILTGVRVAEVGIDFVSFIEVGSPGAGVYVIMVDKIVGIEY